MSDADLDRQFRIFVGAALIIGQFIARRQKTITWTLFNRVYQYRPGGQKLAIFPLPLKNLMEGVL
jgi:hypothetical protein